MRVLAEIGLGVIQPKAEPPGGHRPSRERRLAAGERRGPVRPLAIRRPLGVERVVFLVECENLLFRLPIDLGGLRLRHRPALRALAHQCPLRLQLASRFGVGLHLLAQLREPCLIRLLLLCERLRPLLAQRHNLDLEEAVGLLCDIGLHAAGQGVEQRTNRRQLGVHPRGAGGGLGRGDLT